MLEVLGLLLGWLFIGLMFVVTYVSCHVVQEQKAGRYLPLPWEKKDNPLFDKSKIKYRDGDNT